MRSNMAKDGARIVGDANDLLTGLCTQVHFFMLSRTHTLLAFTHSRVYRGVLDRLLFFQRGT